ncbi:hypothetical protein KY363_04620, partial [Candidatus Woesearchaeota archaeon]|nr:hypothetical protein [Candidatus Woesearchaeota archaeon]
MSRAKDVTRHLLPIVAGAAGLAAAGEVILNPSDAIADTSSRPAMTRKALERVVVEHQPHMRIDPTATNKAISTSDWTGWEYNVKEAEFVPLEQQRHENSVRKNIIGSGHNIYLLSSITSIKNGVYQPQVSYDLFGIVGLPNRLMTRDPMTGRKVRMDRIPNAPINVHLDDSTVRVYSRDIYSHWKAIEYADILSAMANIRKRPFTDAEAISFVLLNADKMNEGRMNPSKMHVLRTFSEFHGAVTNVYEGRGDVVWDVMYECP